MNRTIDDELKMLFKQQKKDNYCKLIELAEIADEELCDDENLNMNLALAKILKYGTARDMAQGINFHTQYLHALNELEQFKVPKPISAVPLQA